MNELHRKMIFGACATLAMAVPTGMALGSYTTSHMRRDYMYGYSVPDPSAPARARVADYRPADPLDFDDDHSVFTAVPRAGRDAKASFDAVYFPSGDDRD